MKKYFRYLAAILIGLLSVLICCAAAPAEEKPKHTVRQIEYKQTEEEKKIYSFVQVPAEYCYHREWSGDWTEIEAGGQKFFYFGCGICCLSNMCCTLTPEFSRPDRIFDLAKTYTEYNPDSGRGALSWRQLSEMCSYMGLKAEVRIKPEDYAVFQKEVSESDTTLVLVCR